MNPFPDTISSYLAHARWVASDLRLRSEAAWRNANLLMSVSVGVLVLHTGLVATSDLRGYAAGSALGWVFAFYRLLTSLRRESTPGMWGRFVEMWNEHQSLLANGEAQTATDAEVNLIYTLVGAPADGMTSALEEMDERATALEESNKESVRYIALALAWSGLMFALYILL